MLKTFAIYRNCLHHNSLLLPVVLSEQYVPGSFAFALNYLVDHELDLSALDAQFNNEKVGASAYDPRVMLKIVLLAYSQGLISSRTIEQAYARNIQFIANLGIQIKPLFSQVLMTCDTQGLIGRDMFAIPLCQTSCRLLFSRRMLRWSDRHEPKTTFSGIQRTSVAQVA